MWNRKAIKRGHSIKKHYQSWGDQSGFAVESVIENLIKCDVVIIFQIKIFWKEAMEFIVSMLLKLFQRSALGSVILSC